jgi:TRAP-type C4-dicarboxylate transport system substrate-binding protein
MANENVLAVLQEAVRSAIYEAANEEIKKHREQFEQEMQKTKRELVGKIVNTIQISATHDLPKGEYVIQIRLSGGAEDGKAD